MTKVKNSKKRIKRNTKIRVRRSSSSHLMPAGEWFDTTWWKAIQDGDLRTFNGTMQVEYELHPDEYPNYEGCDTTFRHDKMGAYLVLPDPDYPPIGFTVIENGKIVDHSASNELKNLE